MPPTSSETLAHVRSSYGLRGRRTAYSTRPNNHQRDSVSQSSSGSLQGVSVSNGKSKYVSNGKQFGVFKVILKELKEARVAAWHFRANSFYVLCDVLNRTIFSWLFSIVQIFFLSKACCYLAFPVILFVNEVIFILCIGSNWILHCVRNLRIVEERMGIIHNPEHLQTYLNKEGIRKNREWKLLQN